MHDPYDYEAGYQDGLREGANRAPMVAFIAAKQEGRKEREREIVAMLRAEADAAAAAQTGLGVEAAQTLRLMAKRIEGGE